MTIDMHAHWVTSELADVLRTREVAPIIKQDGEGGEYVQYPQGTIPLQKDFDNIEARLASMDKFGVDVGVLSLSGVFGLERLPVEESLPLVQLYNDGVARLCEEYPDRFRGIAILPIADFDASVAEFDRAMGLTGMIGVLLPGNGFLDYARAEKFRPLFEIADKHSAHVFVHTGPLPNDDSLPPPDTIDNATVRRSTLDMQARISSNVITFALTDFLNSYPNVTIQCHNLGGNIPFELERLDHISIDRTPDVPTPSSRVRGARIYVDCNSMGSRGIERAVEVYGADKIFYGTDGTDFGADWSNKAVAEAKITDAEKQAILHDNAAAILARTSAVRQAAE